MRPLIGLITLLLLSLGTTTHPRLLAEGAARPNIVVILTDNHGAWTLGCYGNQDIRTPNIDRLANEGTLFTRAFASNPVCSPTRATLLTGLMPSQHGVHCFLTGGRLQTGPDARCTLDQLTSLPEVLRAEGYKCGLVGKWHLGGNLQAQEGLDDYWITMPHGGTSTFYDAQIIENGAIRKEPQYLTDFWTDHAVKFIEQQAGAEQPFFLFLSYNGPYSLSRLLLRDGKNRHAAFYATQGLPSFPREKTHPWQFSNRDFINNPTSIRRVATEVSGVDDGVGRVMDQLARLGIDDETLIVFLADQGWVGGHGGLFGMGDHTRPVTAFDGMMRIPMIWRHPGKIQSGLRSDCMISGYDVMPTLLGHLGMDSAMPKTPTSPGRDFSLELVGDQSAEERSDPVFYEFEGLRCIRTERWKYVQRYANGPDELFDLQSDPDEQHNLIEELRYRGKRDALRTQLSDFFNKYAEPKYDLWNGGTSQARMFVGVDEELAQTEPTDRAVTTGEEGLNSGIDPKGFVLPEGFEISLVAAPPLVNHPTFATFDERGRLFVCDNAGVNMTAEQLEKELPNTIRMLEDQNGDGVFDKSTVFADDMTFPMGGAWHDDALYVASPPNIWKLADTDGDGVADERSVLVDKFGYTGNAASIHGCVNGPDGRLYWCDGYHGHEFKNEQGQVTSQREGSYIFSCKPDGSDVRLYCGGGMDNPVEVDFTDAGEMLGTVNIMYTRPRIDCLVHWLYGGVYPHRERVLSEIKNTGDWLQPTHRFGHVAVSGMLRYRSGALNHRWRDNLFVTFFNSGRVVRMEMAPEGSSVRATQREFLSSSDPDFHVTDIAEDADGSLLVVDTGGWFYRGCPTSQFAKPDVLGGIYRVRKKGMTSWVDPRGLRIDWLKLTDTQLVALLGDTRPAVRQQAIAQCAKRGPKMVALLGQAVRRRDILYRQNALWALTRLIGEYELPDAQSVIRDALSDRDEAIQLQACHALATYPDQAALPKLSTLLRHNNPSIRRQAATSIGRIGSPSAVGELLLASETATDRAEQHAIIYALIEINHRANTRSGLTAQSAAQRLVALIALDQMDDGDLTVDDILPLLSADHPPLVLRAAQIYERHPEWSSSAATVLQPLLANTSVVEAEGTLLSRLLSESFGQADVVSIATRLLQSQDVTRQSIAFKAIAMANRPQLPTQWIEPLRDGLAASDDALRELAIDAVATIKTQEFVGDLQELASNDSLGTMVRVAALQAKSGQRSKLSDASFGLLREVLAQPTSKETAEAVRVIESANLSVEQLLELAGLLKNASPAHLRQLIRPFERSRDKQVAEAFLAGMRSARGLKSLQVHEFSDVIKRYPQDLLPTANRILGQIKDEESRRVAKLDRLLPLLSNGDPRLGRDLFFAEKSKCSACHQIGKQGTRIGPDLSNIGANRSPQDLLESIVFPSASIVRDFESYSVLTKDGRALTGMLLKETAEAVALQPQSGEPIHLDREEIDQVLPAAVSIMPNGLDEALSEIELAHVIAFLSAQKVEVQ